MDLEPQRTEISHLAGCLLGVAVGALWTTVGFLVAALQGTRQQFLNEWFLLQGFPMMAVGTWLLYIIVSGRFEHQIATLTDDQVARPLRNSNLGFVVTGLIGFVGTASLITLGFDAHGIVLAFFWLTCALVCLTAGYVTAHAVEILLVIHRLQRRTIKIFRYAPAQTPALRNLVSYFGSFTLLMTIGYALALIGTLDPNWTGTKTYVDAVRLGWPMLYVPTCSIALIYPHLVVHRLIRHEKDQTLLSCQRDIDALLQKYADLNKDDIDRTNSLTQLFDRITSTPNYVLDFGVAARTLLPLAVNVASLFAKTALGRS